VADSIATLRWELAIEIAQRLPLYPGFSHSPAFNRRF